MTDYLAPMNYNRARDVLNGLSAFHLYSETDAHKALQLLRSSYPMVFSKLQEKTFSNQALLLETQGGSLSGPLVLLAHLDAPPCPAETDAESGAMRVPLSRAHLIALLEALEALLYDSFVPSGDLILCISMDSLSEAKGMQEIADYLHRRSVHPCFVLDWGGYVSAESFKTFLRKTTLGTQPPIALVGITEKGQITATVTPEEGCAKPVRALFKAGKALAVRQHRYGLCAATRQMLHCIAAECRLFRRRVLSYTAIAFPFVALRWRKRTVYRHFFSRSGYIFNGHINGSQIAMPTDASFQFSQELLPGETCSRFQHRLSRRLRHVCIQYQNTFDASECASTATESWDALNTAVQIQFEHVLVVPCLSPYPTDARFFSKLCNAVYRFSPFLLTDQEASNGNCLLTDDHLQTAVQFFRGMISV